MIRPIPKKTFVIVLNKKRWKVYLYSKQQMESVWPDTLGITMYDKNLREIYVRGPIVSYDTIAHELLHAYLADINFRNKSPSKVEEKICEVIGQVHKRLYFLTKELYKKLNG